MPPGSSRVVGSYRRLASYQRTGDDRQGTDGPPGSYASLRAGRDGRQAGRQRGGLLGQGIAAQPGAVDDRCRRSRREGRVGQARLGGRQLSTGLCELAIEARSLA